MLRADDLVGLSEASKTAKIAKLFTDAYKSPLSMIVIDDIERCLDYTPIGPRFSNQVLQTLLVYVKKPPPRGHSLMVVGTTAVAHLLEDLQLNEAFHVTLEVPLLSAEEEFKAVLRHSTAGAKMGEKELQAIVGSIKEPIGVKKLLRVTEMARCGEDAHISHDKFLEWVVV